MTKTAETLRAEASASYQAAYDSFERCDTDGFLSQWASQCMGQLRSRQAEITEAGRTAIFVGLYCGDERIPARQITSEYGTSWLIRDAEDQVRFGRKFIPVGARSKIQKSLGLSERAERAPAWCKHDGDRCNVYVVTFRTGCKFGTDAVLA